MSPADFERMFQENLNDHRGENSSLKSRQKNDTMRNIRWSYNPFWTADNCKDLDSFSDCIIVKIFRQVISFI